MNPTARSSSDKHWVSLFKNAITNEMPKEFLMEGIMERIQSGEWKSRIEALREIYRKTLRSHGMKAAKLAIKETKEQLPAFTASGVFGDRGAKTLKHPSGLLAADLDDLGGELEATREKLKRSPYIRHGFVSPRETGYKAIFRVPRDGSRHIASFEAVKAHLVDLFGQPFVDEHLDERCKDIGRLCFVSYDPEPIFNWDAVEIEVPKEPIYNYSSTILHSTPLHDCTTAQLHSLHNNDVIEGLRAMTNGKRALGERFPKQHVDVLALYVRLVESRYEAAPGNRNGFIVNAAPFLFRALSPKMVLEFVSTFYDCNHPIFTDPKTQHMNEATSHLAAVSKTYVESLNSTLREIYEVHLENDTERDAFRICGDLAMHTDSSREPLTFYMPSDKLAARLGLEYSIQADRVLKKFEKHYKFIKTVTKGNRRSKDKPALATTYRWMIEPAPSQINFNPVSLPNKAAA